MGETERRRRRIRPPSAAVADSADPAGRPVPRPQPRPRTAALEAGGPVGPAAVTGAIEDAVEAPPRPSRPPRARPAGAEAGAGGEESERGLRGLVGSGSSQVSVGAALRARDAARPTDEQLADAEANLSIVRRNWTPREDLPRR